MNLLKNLSIISLAVTLNYGCSDNGNNTPPPSPNGIYSGNITGGDSSSNGIEEKGIIYNNRLMVLSKQISGNSQMFDGNLTVTGTSLTGSGSRYSSILLLNSVEYNGSFADKKSINLDFTTTDGSSSLPDGSMPLTASTALFSKTAASDKLTGTWSGIYSSNLTVQMTISLNGNGIITSGGDSPADCLFTGSITPADPAINVYDVTIISDGGSSAFNCGMLAGTYTGLAWTEGDTDNTLVLMVSNAALNRNRAVILTKN